jgi:hypothetical protein
MEHRRYGLTITGMTPIIFHSTALMLISKQERPRDPFAYESEHFRELAYYSPEGELVIPVDNIMGSLLTACSFITVPTPGRKRSPLPFVESAVIVENDALLTPSSPDKLVPLVKIVRLNPNRPKGPRGPRCRPMLPVPWSATTTVSIIDDVISDEVINALGDAAGRYVGICDGRNRLRTGRAEWVFEPIGGAKGKSSRKHSAAADSAS